LLALPRNVDLNGQVAIVAGGYCDIGREVHRHLNTPS
jgi:hypothetical protein